MLELIALSPLIAALAAVIVILAVFIIGFGILYPILGLLKALVYLTDRTTYARLLSYLRHQ